MVDGRLVTLPGKTREDRDQRGQFCIFDETFTRRNADGQVETHPLWVANPPRDWPALLGWAGLGGRL